jgi:hypothetical protein
MNHGDTHRQEGWLACQRAAQDALLARARAHRENTLKREAHDCAMLIMELPQPFNFVNSPEYNEMVAAARDARGERRAPDFVTSQAAKGQTGKGCD